MTGDGAAVSDGSGVTVGDSVSLTITPITVNATPSPKATRPREYTPGNSGCPVKMLVNEPAEIIMNPIMIKTIPITSNIIPVDEDANLPRSIVTPEDRCSIALLVKTTFEE
jgi:hypothetical protein